MVIVATRKTRKNNCSDYKQTTKQDNKEINKQATNASLLQLLHILHPLGIKVRHQYKYREQSSILHTLAVKIGHQCKYTRQQNKSITETTSEELKKRYPGYPP